MENKAYLSWVEFYSAFATKLLDFAKDRKVLIAKLQSVYKSIGIKFPKVDSSDTVADIDPFTIFGLFNKGITDANRIAILNGVAKEFAIDATVPVTFDGIPVLNNLNATFYRFVGDPYRGEHDIDNLWGVFDAAIAYADSTTTLNQEAFISAYDLVKDLKGNRWKLTMGLYWVRPMRYVNLDSRNRWFIENQENMPSSCIAMIKGLNSVPAGIDYIGICEAFTKALSVGSYKYKNFPELSYYAWTISEKVNHEHKLVGTEEIKKSSGAAFLKWMRPVIEALKELSGSGSPNDVRGKIIDDLNLTNEVLTETRGKSNVNKFENEVAFARNYLVYEGVIDKSVHGIWALTEKGYSIDMTDELASHIFVKWAAANKIKRGNTGAAIADENVDTVHYWIYAPGDGACKWEEFYNEGIVSIGWGAVGDLSAFSSKDEMKARMKECYGAEYSYKNAAHATWQFANEMKPGDIVFVKKGMHQILGRGVVTSDYTYQADRPDDYNNVRKINWTNEGEWPHPGQAVMKTLTDITAYTDYVEKLSALFETEVEDSDEEKAVSYPPYGIDNFLEEVYMNEEEYNKLVALLSNKKNIILQGAPGVGKTYAAKRLAYSIMGIKDKDRVMMIQFHQSYSYEDFIMGFRPSERGFELRKGAFYNFCKAAEIDNENAYFFIIDEINRGNLSKIFGELFMLIENDKRGIELQLLYSDEKFAVPENVYIIGMMNTADRSLAMLDYALRRRFAFYEIKPAFDSDGFRAYRTERDNLKFDRLISCVQNLNMAITADDSLGEGFCIGHSYFCNFDELDDQMLSGIVEYELIPLLKEYWFDEPLKVKDWSSNLRSAIR